MSTVIQHCGTGDLNGLNDFVGAQVAEGKVTGSIDEAGTVQWCDDNVTVLLKKDNILFVKDNLHLPQSTI